MSATGEGFDVLGWRFYLAPPGLAAYPRRREILDEDMDGLGIYAADILSAHDVADAYIKGKGRGIEAGRGLMASELRALLGAEAAR